MPGEPEAQLTTQQSSADLDQVVFELRGFTLSYSTNQFFVRVFQDRVCLLFPWAGFKLILLIPAS
jgi:hypothetical protein